MVILYSITAKPVKQVVTQRCCRMAYDFKPADLPVEEPTKFELMINLKAAKQISVTIPQKVLTRADRVIK